MTRLDPDRVILAITIRDYRPELMQTLFRSGYDVTTHRLADGRFFTELRWCKITAVH